MTNDSDSATRAKLENVLQRRVRAWQALAGGMISQRAARSSWMTASSLVAKIGDGGHDLTIEAFMLRYLRARSGLPVPAVLHAEPSLLHHGIRAGAQRLGGRTAASPRRAAGRLPSSDRAMHTGLHAIP